MMASSRRLMVMRASFCFQWRYGRPGGRVIAGAPHIPIGSPGGPAVTEPNPSIHHFAGLTSTSIFISTGPSCPAGTLLQARRRPGGELLEAQAIRGGCGLLPRADRQEMGFGTLPATRSSCLARASNVAVRSAAHQMSAERMMLDSSLALLSSAWRSGAWPEPAGRSARSSITVQSAGNAHLRLSRLLRLRVDRCRPPVALELGACFLKLFRTARRRPPAAAEEPTRRNRSSS